MNRKLKAIVNPLSTRTHVVNSSVKPVFRARKQSGSALVIAIFIIIVMSLLGATLVNMLNSSQKNVAYEVLGSRAYTVAQSGLQWQLSQIFPLGSSAVACVAIEPPNFNNTVGYHQCSATVSCSDFVHENIRYYTVTSTGQCDIDGDVTSRTVQVEARSL